MNVNTHYISSRAKYGSPQKHVYDHFDQFLWFVFVCMLLVLGIAAQRIENFHGLLHYARSTCREKEWDRGETDREREKDVHHGWSLILAYHHCCIVTVFDHIRQGFKIGALWFAVITLISEIKEFCSSRSCLCTVAVFDHNVSSFCCLLVGDSSLESLICSLCVLVVVEHLDYM